MGREQDGGSVAKRPVWLHDALASRTDLGDEYSVPEAAYSIKIQDCSHTSNRGGVMSIFKKLAIFCLMATALTACMGEDPTQPKKPAWSNQAPDRLVDF
jgi:hypothetical protein